MSYMEGSATILLAAASAEEGISLKVRLEAFGYKVRLVTTGASAVRTFNRLLFGGCIICESLPAVDGLSTLRGLRSLSERVPVIVIGSFEQEYARLTRYEAGADSVLSRGFNFWELFYRMEVFRRRSQIPWPSDQRRFTIGNLTFDADAAIISNQQGATLLRCQPRERDLLRVLCGYRNQVLSKDAVLYYLWGKSNKNFSRHMYDMLARIKKRLGKEHTLRVRRVGDAWLQLLTEERSSQTGESMRLEEIK